MIPNKVIICGHEIKICLEDPDSFRTRSVPEWGVNDPGNLTIKLNRSLSQSIIQQTLMHEILHYIHYFTFEDCCSEKSDLTDAKIPLPSYENAFWQFMKDNTNFFNGD